MNFLKLQRSKEYRLCTYCCFTGYIIFKHDKVLGRVYGTLFEMRTLVDIYLIKAQVDLTLFALF